MQVENEKKGTVLHVLNTGTFSGAENVAITIIKAMNARGYRCIYVSFDGTIRRVLEAEGIEFAPISRMSIGELRRVVREYQADMIHAHDFRATVMAALLNADIPVISHLHNNSPWLKKVGPYSLLFALAARRCENIWCVSASVRDEYVFKKAIDYKTRIIGNPICIEKIREKRIPTDDKYDVVFIGRLTEQKNPLRFLKIIKKAKERKPDISAVILGEGELHQECEKYIQKNGLSENVTLKGFVSEPYGILANGKVLCSTSDWEGYGLMAVEAMTFGVPVICARVGGLANVVTDQCGKFCKEDAEFVDAIIDLLDSVDERERLSKGAYQRAQALDNFDKYMGFLEKKYLYLTGEHVCENEIMCDRPLVSVIMGAYNCEDSIAKSIDSILGQTYENWEFIICDDCSTDRTLEILQEYEKKDSRIKILHNERNIRLAGTLNKCLSYANGKYVARMDGDDESLSERFEKQVAFLEANPQIDVVGCSRMIFDEHGDKGIRFSERMPRKDTLLKEVPFAHPTIMIRTEVMRELGGYTKNRKTMRAEDLELWFRFYCRDYVGYNMQDVLYRYRETLFDLKKRTVKAAIGTAKIYLDGYKMLHFPVYKWIWAMKPIVASCLPVKIMKKYYVNNLKMQDNLEQ